MGADDDVDVGGQASGQCGGGQADEVKDDDREAGDDGQAMTTMTSDGSEGQGDDVMTDAGRAMPGDGAGQVDEASRRGQGQPNDDDDDVMSVRA